MQIMQTTSFLIASMAIFGAMATPAPSQMGIEVIRRDGLTMVREVVSSNELAQLQSPVANLIPRLARSTSEHAPTAFTSAASASSERATAIPRSTLLARIAGTGGSSVLIRTGAPALHPKSAESGGGGAE